MSPLYQLGTVLQLFRVGRRGSELDVVAQDLQFGDGPSAYENSSFQKVLSNAIRWAASESAREWALADANAND